ncbi:MAG: alanine/glycine:cation symporter family protein [Bacteroidota bacterium]
MNYIESLIVNFANWIWGFPLLILLMGGGLFFVAYSRLVPYKFFFHAINVLRGKYDDPDEEGQINHYQALSTQLASTVGMGNISGVAVAMVTGGPGAIFWMWISALVGIATKYFTSTLAIMYRSKGSNEKIYGGPMYVIKNGLHKNWRPLAYLFCIAGTIGCLPIFQANQLTQVIRDVLVVPNGITSSSIALLGTTISSTDLYTGLILTVIVSAVIFGGLKRIAGVASQTVPIMVVLYFVMVSIILLTNISKIPQMLGLIIEDAFTGNAVLGGSLGAIIIAGARRAAFSNEAGIGTAPIAHGAAKTDEPVREGLVAMLGPFIDTIIVCTLTALTIISTGQWQKRIDSDRQPNIILEHVQNDQESEIIIQAKEQKNNDYLSSSWQGDELTYSIDQLSDSIIVNINGPEKTVNALNLIENIPISISYTYNEKNTRIVIRENQSQGVTVKAKAFEASFPGFGSYLLLTCILFFAVTSLFSYSWYGSRCLGFIIGENKAYYYNYFYVATIVIGATSSLASIMSLIDGAFAIMAIPTVLSTILLAPKVWEATKDYHHRFRR